MSFNEMKRQQYKHHGPAAAGDFDGEHLMKVWSEFGQLIREQG